MASRASESLSRRAFARLTIMGAVGLSLLPGCGKQRAGWSELGAVWREINERARSPKGIKSFDRLEDRMDAALDAVYASPELRDAFDGRYVYVRGRQRLPSLSLTTCYKMVGPPPPRAAWDNMERRIDDRMVADGTLTEEAGEKAAAAMAEAVEAVLQASELFVDHQDAWEQVEKLEKQYEAGELEPREAAREVGRILAVLTVDDPGWLSNTAYDIGDENDPYASTCYMMEATDD